MPSNRFPISLICAFLALVAFQPGDAGSVHPNDSSMKESNTSPSAVVVWLQPVKSEWAVDEFPQFSISVMNGEDEPNRIPYSYDAILEIDGKLYAIYPKPRLFPDPKRKVGPHSSVDHGYLTLNKKDGLRIFDAKTGRIPLILGIGDHTLLASFGAYKSNVVSFKIRKK